jgi:transcriptional regulator with XRE-family HTH domain
MINSQELANKIKSLLKSKKITVGKMLSDCELSINTLASMQSGGYYPRIEAICKISDYLDCSVDYLLGRTENPESHKN